MQQISTFLYLLNIQKHNNRKIIKSRFQQMKKLNQ